MKDVEIIQFTINDSYYQTLLRISSGKPDGLFFSAYVWNSDLIRRLLRDLGCALPTCSLVVGGPQAGIIGREMENGKCCVIHGAVEQLDSAFYKDLAANRLRPSYGANNTPRSGFPFPYQPSDFQTSLNNRTIYYESSRGCPFSCTYCLSAMDNTVHRKPVEVVKREIRQILAHEPMVVRFVDRTFNDVPERALAIWDFLMREDVSTLFHFEISPRGFTPEMFELLASVASGRFQFEIGIQSTNTKTLAAIRRPSDIDQQLDIISRLAAQDNIHLHTDLILGLPFETESSYLQSFARLFPAGSHYIQMGLLKILPDTPIAKSCQEFEIHHCACPPYEIMSTRWMDTSTVQHLYWFGECAEKFYNTRYFPSIWNYLRGVDEDIVQFFSDILHISHQRSLFNRAATQKLLSEIIVQLTEKREDGELIHELLRHDWLRCGHRSLPDHLQVEKGEQQPVDLKKYLYGSLPGQIEGLYTKKTRNYFFRKTLFFYFSANSLDALGYGKGKNSGILCFLPERETSLFQLNRVVRVDGMEQYSSAES